MTEPLRVRRFTAFDPLGQMRALRVGSGTTGVAALRHGRRFIGIEMDAAYLEGIARPRLQAEVDAFNGVPEVGVKPVSKPASPDAESLLWDEIDGIVKTGR